MSKKDKLKNEIKELKMRIRNLEWWIAESE